MIITQSFDKEAFKKSVKENVRVLYRKNLDEATSQQIYQAVWQEEYVYDDNTIMVQISHLRSKIDDEEHKHIDTLVGIGYRFH